MLRKRKKKQRKYIKNHEKKKKALSEPKKYDRCISITHINRKYHKVISTKPFFISTTLSSLLLSLLFPFHSFSHQKNKKTSFFNTYNPYACSTSISNLKFLSLIQRYH